MSYPADLKVLRQIALQRGQLIIKSDVADVYALVMPDFWGPRTDPRGAKAAAAAFAEGRGVPLGDIADLLFNPSA